MLSPEATRAIPVDGECALSAVGLLLRLDSMRSPFSRPLWLLAKLPPLRAGIVTVALATFSAQGARSRDLSRSVSAVKRSFGCSRPLQCYEQKHVDPVQSDTLLWSYSRV